MNWICVGEKKNSYFQIHLAFKKAFSTSNWFSILRIIACNAICTYFLSLVCISICIVGADDDARSSLNGESVSVIGSRHQRYRCVTNTIHFLDRNTILCVVQCVTERPSDHTKNKLRKDDKWALNGCWLQLIQLKVIRDDFLVSSHFYLILFRLFFHFKQSNNYTHRDVVLCSVDLYGGD